MKKLLLCLALLAPVSASLAMQKISPTDIEKARNCCMAKTCAGTSLVAQKIAGCCLAYNTQLNRQQVKTPKGNSAVVFMQWVSALSQQACAVFGCWSNEQSKYFEARTE